MADGILFLHYEGPKGRKQSIDFGSEYKFDFNSETNTLSVEDNIHHIPFFTIIRVKK